MKITLGKEYKDSISGFSGIATARTIYLHGCIRILLTPNKLKSDGDFLPDCWFDEPQIVTVRSGKITEPKTRKPIGGPERAIAPSKDPV